MRGDSWCCLCEIIQGFQINVTLLDFEGLVMHDPEIPLDRTLIPSPPTRPKHPVFDNEDMGKVTDTTRIKCLSCDGMVAVG